MGYKMKKRLTHDGLIAQGYIKEVVEEDE